MEKQYHPAVSNLLGYFSYAHLPDHLQSVSRECHDLAGTTASMPGSDAT